MQRGSRWLLLLLAVPAPAALVGATLAYDTEDRESTQHAALVRGQLLDLIRIPTPPDAAPGWPADHVWRFRVDEVLRAGDHATPAPGEVIEVHKELFPRPSDADMVPGRRLDLAVMPYERHVPETGRVYWRGWSLADARDGAFWTVQERHFAAAAWLGAASLGAAALLAASVPASSRSAGPPGSLAKGLPAAALTGLALAMLVAAHGSDQLLRDDGEGNYWASPFLVASAFVGTGLAAGAAAWWRRGAPVAAAVAALAVPLLAVALQPQEGLADPAWRESVGVVAALMAAGWLAWLPWRWANALCLAAGTALLAFAAFVALVAPHDAAPSGALMAVGLWGLPAILGVLLAVHGLVSRHDARRSAAPPPSSA